MSGHTEGVAEAGVTQGGPLGPLHRPLRAESSTGIFVRAYPAKDTWLAALLGTGAVSRAGHTPLQEIEIGDLEVRRHAGAASVGVLARTEASRIV